MEAQGKRRIVDAHMHLYDSLENRYEHLEQPDGILEALIGDYSALPKRYRFEDYVPDLRNVEIDGVVWHEFIATDSVREVNGRSAFQFQWRLWDWCIFLLRTWSRGWMHIQSMQMWPRFGNTWDGMQAIRCAVWRSEGTC
jgi:hypothetical protein